MNDGVFSATLRLTEGSVTVDLVEGFFDANFNDTRPVAEPSSLVLLTTSIVIARALKRGSGRA